MTEEAKRDWLLAAWATLKHLPVDILKTSAQKARLSCDHHAKIVPAIVEDSKDWMRLRREAAREDTERLRIAAPERCTPEQARSILEEFGLASKFASNRDPA